MIIGWKIYNMPTIKINPKQYISLEKVKPLEKWSNRDFLLYFSSRYRELGHPFLIPKEAWVGLMSRMKGFRTKLTLDNETYKKLIDDVFDKFFTKNGYIPNFGSIVSEKVYHVVQRLNKQKIQSKFSDTEFERLRNELYSNNELFKRLT